MSTMSPGASGLEPVNGIAPAAAQSDAQTQANNQDGDSNRSYLETAVHSIVGLCWHDESSPLRKTIEGDASQFLATVPLFIGGSRGYVLSAALNGLNEAKVGDTTENQIEDLGLGAVKGVASKGVVDLVGRQRGPGWSFAAKGVAMGVGLRTLNTGLDRSTYYNNGQLDIAGGLLDRTIGGALNPASMAMDAATFGVARYGLGFANSATRSLSAEGTGLFMGPRTASMFTGATAGFVSGSMGEAQRQMSDNTHDFDWGKIVGAGANDAVVMGLAGGVGAQLSPRGSRVVRNLGPESDPSWLWSRQSLSGDFSGTAPVPAQDGAAPVPTLDDAAREINPPMIDASHTPIDVTPASDWLAGNPEGQLQLANSVKFGSDWLAAHPDARPEYYQGNNNLVNANSDARDLFRAMLGPSIIDSPLVHPGAGEIALRSLSGLAGRQLIVQPPEGALINGNTSAWELGDSVSRGMRFLSENPGFRPQFIQNGSDTYEPFDGSAEQLQDRMWLNIYNRLGTGQYALRTLMDLAPERVTNRDLRIDPTADGARAGVAVSMLKGLRWLSENPSAQPEFGTDGKMYFPENQEAVALRKAMGLDESGVGTSDFSLRIMAERTRTAFGNRVTIHPDPEASAPVDYNKEIWAVLPYLEIEGKVSDGQRWLRMNPDARPEFKNVDGKYIPANADAAALSNAMPLRLQSAFATNDIYLDVLRQQTDRVSLIDPASSSDASDRGALVIPAATNEVTDTQ